MPPGNWSAHDMLTYAGGVSEASSPEPVAGAKRPSAAVLVLAVSLVLVLRRLERSPSVAGPGTVLPLVLALLRLGLIPSVAGPGTVVCAGWGPRRRTRFELRAAP